MFTGPARAAQRRAFTLLEIMLAVAILGMMSLTIYRFVQANMVALHASSDANAVDAQYAAFVSLLSTEWVKLPSGSGAMTGEPLKTDGRQRDEIRWRCGAGAGLMTRYAKGEYQVSMRLQPVTKGSDRLEIGFLRKSYDPTRKSEGEESWVPLLPDVQSLQIKYFDPRLNVWVDKWTDSVSLPRLVKVIVGRASNPEPWEAVIALARTPL